MDWRRLSQCCLHAKQERDSEREGRLSAAPRRGIWLDNQLGRDRHGGGSQAQARNGRSPSHQAPGELQGERRRVDHGVWSVHRAEDDRGAPQ